MGMPDRNLRPRSKNISDSSDSSNRSNKMSDINDREVTKVLKNYLRCARAALPDDEKGLIGDIQRCVQAVVDDSIGPPIEELLKAKSIIAAALAYVEEFKEFPMEEHLIAILEGKVPDANKKEEG